MKRILLFRFAILIFAARGLDLPALGQGNLGDGTFQNLDFSSADVQFIGSSGVEIYPGPALPGWSPTIGAAEPSSMLYNDIYTGSAGIALLGPTQPAVNGDYTVVLEGGVFAQSGPVSLQQTGIVPAGANSIQFLSGTYPFYPKSVNEFGLNINGQPVSLVPLSVANNIWTYGGNISQSLPEISI